MNKHQIITNAREWIASRPEDIIDSTEVLLIRDLLSLVDSQEPPILTDREVSCSGDTYKAKVVMEPTYDTPVPFQPWKHYGGEYQKHPQVYDYMGENERLREHIKDAILHIGVSQSDVLYILRHALYGEKALFKQEGEI